MCNFKKTCFADGSSVTSTDGLVIACDRQKFTPIENVIQIFGDFTHPSTQNQITDKLREVCTSLNHVYMFVLTKFCAV